MTPYMKTATEHIQEAERQTTAAEGDMRLDIKLANAATAQAHAAIALAQLAEQSVALEPV